MADKKGSVTSLRDTSEEEDGFVHVGAMEKSLKPSKDSLDSDIQSLDSLQSITKSMDSLENGNDNIGDSLEDLTCEFEESSLMRSMDQDLENVIAEATKLQTQVLESIIGGNEDGKEYDEMNWDSTEYNAKRYSCLETAEVMEELESQINEHSSEKETFSKGIAAIIYEPIQKEEAVIVNEESELKEDMIETGSNENILEYAQNTELNSEIQQISYQKTPNIELEPEDKNFVTDVEKVINN